MSISGVRGSIFAPVYRTSYNRPSVEAFKSSANAFIRDNAKKLITLGFISHGVFSREVPASFDDFRITTKAFLPGFYLTPDFVTLVIRDRELITIAQDFLERDGKTWEAAFLSVLTTEVASKWEFMQQRRIEDEKTELKLEQEVCNSWFFEGMLERAYRDMSAESNRRHAPVEIKPLT